MQLLYLCVQQMRTQQTERACLSPLMRCQSCCGLMTSAGLSPFRQSDGRVQQKPGHRTGHSMNRTRNVFVCSTGRHVGPRNLQTAKTKKNANTNEPMALHPTTFDQPLVHGRLFTLFGPDGRTRVWQLLKALKASMGRYKTGLLPTSAAAADEIMGRFL